MTSLYSVTREDLYDYFRCPKIVSIKAYKTLTEEKRVPTPSQRAVEPADVGMIGEAAVQLGFSGVGTVAAMQQISYSIPELNRNQLLKQIAAESLRGVEKIRERLRAEYGEITIIGKGQGRQPDLAGTVLPDRLAFSSENRVPIIVEVKNSRHQGPADKFQAKFYNGVAETSGLYLLEERVEGQVAKLNPRVIHGEAETILVYPRLGASSIIKEKFVPSRPMIREVWTAKELGLSGFSIESNCGVDCPHHRLKVELPEGNIEPLPPLPLVFSKGLVEEDWNLDLEYQVNYGGKLLPPGLKSALFFHARNVDGRLEVWKDWLVQDGGLDKEAAEIALSFRKGSRFYASKPKPTELFRSMRGVVDRWRRILKKRFRTSTSVLVGRAASVYALPAKSTKLVNDAWKKWED
jgi:hypothetical protein